MRKVESESGERRWGKGIREVGSKLLTLETRIELEDHGAVDTEQLVFVGGLSVTRDRGKVGDGGLVTDLPLFDNLASLEIHAKDGVLHGGVQQEHLAVTFMQEGLGRGEDIAVFRLDRRNLVDVFELVFVVVFKNTNLQGEEEGKEIKS